MEWRPIVDYPEYEVSNAGDIRRGGRVLKPGRGNGYLIVQLGRNNKKYVHRLVALAFISNPENKPQVDHINRIRSDNRIENLRWATKSENQINTLTRSPHTNIFHIKGSYQVKISRNSTYVFCKTYATLAEAITARDATLLTPDTLNV